MLRRRSWNSLLVLNAPMMVLAFCKRLATLAICVDSGKPKKQHLRCHHFRSVVPDMASYSTSDASKTPVQLVLFDDVSNAAQVRAQLIAERWACACVDATMVCLPFLSNVAIK